MTKSFEGTAFTVKSIDYHGSDSAGYLLTYIFPFITTNLNNLQDVIFLGFMFLLIGVIYVNTNMLFANPIQMDQLTGNVEWTINSDTSKCGLWFFNYWFNNS